MTGDLQNTQLASDHPKDGKANGTKISKQPYGLK